MKMFVALISGALLSSAAIAQHEHGASTGGGNETRMEAAEPAAANPNTAPGVSQADGAERQICRRFDNTSSRLRRERVCKTAAQWREYDRSN